MRGWTNWVVPTLALAGAGCSGSEPGVYPLPLAEAFGRLDAADFSDFRLKRQCGVLIHFRPSAVPNDRIKWRVTSGGRELFDFTARLTPVSADETRVTLEMTPDPRSGEPYDGRKFYARPAVRQPIRPALERQIDAVLRGKEFEVDGLPDGDNAVCEVQRAGLEVGGRAFHVDRRLDDQ